MPTMHDPEGVGERAMEHNKTAHKPKYIAGGKITDRPDPVVMDITTVLPERRTELGIRDTEEVYWMQDPAKPGAKHWGDRFNQFNRAVGGTARVITNDSSDKITNFDCILVAYDKAKGNADQERFNAGSDQYQSTLRQSSEFDDAVESDVELFNMQDPGDRPPTRDEMKRYMRKVGAQNRANGIIRAGSDFESEMSRQSPEDREAEAAMWRRGRGRHEYNEDPMAKHKEAILRKLERDHGVKNYAIGNAGIGKTTQEIVRSRASAAATAR